MIAMWKYPSYQPKMRERYSWRKSIWRWLIIGRSSLRRSVLCVLAEISGDFIAGEHPIVVEIGDYVFHVWRRQCDGATAVAEIIEQDRQRELPRAFAVIGPFEAIFGETLDLVMLRQAIAVDGDDEAIDGALALVAFHD